jgi:hypothetical protein
MKVYNSARIYKIFDTTNELMFYIGSTSEELSSRMSKHRYSSKSGKHDGMLLYKYVNGLPEKWDNMKIELVEFINREIQHDELLKIEGKYQKELNPPMNKNIAGRSKQEYNKIFHSEHRDDINERHKEWHLNNKEHEQEYRKKYYQLKKQALKQAL